MKSYMGVTVDIEKEILTFSDGISLNVQHMVIVSQIYERLCTASELMCRFGVDNEDDAWDLAGEVREQMFKYGYSEDDAIEVVLEIALKKGA